MPNCPSCASEISEQNRFCPNCGAPGSSDAFATRTVASGPPARITSSSRSSSAGRFPPGALLAGRYRIIALLGKGGMGEVYRADDLTLDQQVALKFLPQSVASNPDAISRFRNEVRIARQVSHPNVCRVYDLAEVEGALVLSMEYVDGEDLGSLLRRIGRLPPDKALEIGRKLCAGLAAAHEKGVLHRDLKPANVMLDGRGQVLLTDFGLAGLAGEIEGAEVRNGTPAYMAPEQLSGEEVTVRSDIYSLGLVLYEIFTGKLPFESTTLAGLMKARNESAPVSLTTLVRDLDPAVERVILRCLQAKPALRPPSAMAVAAALPGGDPLAAALAAGETPSPEMVAAAGEGQGLGIRAAVPLLLGIVGGLIFTFFTFQRTSALEFIKPDYSPEVLSAKAREVIARAGYPGAPADSVHAFEWNYPLRQYISGHDKPHANWPAVMNQRPPQLLFWYRQSNAPLTAGEFHDDLLTPGMVDREDPAPTEAGMTFVMLDPQGRLLQFERMPEAVMTASKTPAAPPDWSPLFAAAALDVSQLRPAEPLWNWLESSDTRAAWDGVWPGTNRPLHVEAASLRGKPIAFLVAGPWTKPSRSPAGPTSQTTLITDIILFGVAAIVLVTAPLLARANLRKGRGDRQGALRLAAFMFSVQVALWFLRTHFASFENAFGTFLIAIATAVFYGAVMWMVYIAVEPYVRRRWPQSLISWTSALSGRLQDPVVGRDVLIGVALGVSLPVLNGILRLIGAASDPPSAGSLAVLLGWRSTLGAAITQVPHAVRESLFFLFLIFLLRVLLRNQWLAGAAFAAIFTTLNAQTGGNNVIIWLIGAVVYGIFAIVMLRWGLLAMAVGALVSGMLQNIQTTFNSSVWYFPNTLFLFAVVAFLGVWGFRVSMAGRRLWNQDLFE